MSGKAVLIIQRWYRKHSKFSLKYQEQFIKEVRGYHLINKEPIKEARWEEINANILEKFMTLLKTSSGSHSQGWDIKTKYFIFSNKTCIINKNTLKVSSYRLTTINTIDNLITEITKRNNNFTHYSILARQNTTYTWYVIPKNFYGFKPTTYEWIVENKKKFTNFKTNTIRGCSMNVVGAMSSQLWITIDTTVIKQYIVAQTTYTKPVITSYSHLLDLIVQHTSLCTLD